MGILQRCQAAANARAIMRGASPATSRAGSGDFSRRYLVQTAALEDLDLLRQTAREARRLIVQSVYHAGAGHLGGPLSAVDVLTTLYFNVMRLDPTRPDWADRDRFI